ncbi:hypothetical protein ABZ543_16765 [Streptomyces roseifaciens]
MASRRRGPVGSAAPYSRAALRLLDAALGVSDDTAARRHRSTDH